MLMNVERCKISMNIAGIYTRTFYSCMLSMCTLQWVLDISVCQPIRLQGMMRLAL